MITVTVGTVYVPIRVPSLFLPCGTAVCRYQAEESRAVENLLRAYNAQEGTDGWVMVGNMKYVQYQDSDLQ